MKNKAIASLSDEVSVVLYGTDRTNNEVSFEHIFVVQSLQKPSVDRILEIIGIKQLSPQDFAAKFGQNTGHYSLADVFSIASTQFTKSKSHFETKRVFLMTSCPDPYADSTSANLKLMKSNAKKKAKDLKDHNIDVELIPLGDEPFDTELFYEDVLPDVKDKCVDNLTTIKTFMNRIYNKMSRQRITASLPFSLSSSPNDSSVPDVQMSVYVYNLCSETKKPLAVRVRREDNKEVKTKTQIVTQDISAEGVVKESVVKAEEVTKKYNFGNEDIFMDKNVIKDNKQFEMPAITLLGFKPRSAVATHLHVKESHFLYPNEKDIKGSTVLFNALHQRCIARDVIPICRLTLRAKSAPNLVALFPQIEIKPLDKAGGFNVIYLPFKENIRNPAIIDAQELPLDPKGKEIAKDIVHKMTHNYDATNFPNPVLQTHWRAIEALALNYTDVEPFTETQTQPNYAGIEETVGQEINALNTMLGGIVPDKPVKPVTLYADLSTYVQTNKLGNLTVAEMKAFCQSKNIIPSAYRKAEYIVAIHEFYKSK